jgi:hypothetical protein
MEMNYQRAHDVDAEKFGIPEVSNAFLLLYLYPSLILVLIYCIYRSTVSRGFYRSDTAPHFSQIYSVAEVFIAYGHI